MVTFSQVLVPREVWVDRVPRPESFQVLLQEFFLALHQGFLRVHFPVFQESQEHAPVQLQVLMVAESQIAFVIFIVIII